MYENLFITIEGGEGVGKSTFIEGLKDFFSGLGKETLVTREPGGTAIADRIRSVFTDPPEEEDFTVEAELMLVSAARAQHMHHKILPALGEGKVVISDRFADSTRVYQGFLGKADDVFMESVIEKTVFKRHPDMTFLLDCDVEVSIKRVRDRAEQNGEALSRYDKANLEVHQKLRDGFLHYAAKFPNRFIVVDASKTPEEVLNSAISALKERFGIELS